MRVMQPSKRAPTKEELKRLPREDRLTESDIESESNTKYKPEAKPKSKSKPKPKTAPTPTSAPTAKQRARPSTNSSSSRKRLSAMRKPPGYREDQLPSLEISEIDLDLHSGPSTSPSLAGTRSKRSLKVPARFSDPEFAFRDIVEPVKIKPHSRSSSSSSSSSSTSISTSVSSLSESSTTTPAPSTPSKSAQISPVSQKSKTVSPCLKRPSRDEKRENEDAGEQPPPKILKGASHLSVTLKKQSVSLSNETSKAAATASPIRPPLEQVSDSVQASEPSVRSEPASAESQIVRRDSPSKKKKKKPLSKPRPRSPEKACNTNSSSNISFSTDTVGSTINHPVINMTIQPPHQSHKPQLQQLLQQPLPQIQQIHQLSHPPPKQIHVPPYGSRLLPMDQPILLPVSIAPIGPITTNLAAVNGALRKPPFASPMLEMSLKHDKTIRQRLALENLPSMVKIASHLGIKDRINLRRVNKVWKTFIDSATVWKRTILTPEDLDLDTKLLFQHLTRSRTTELQFKVNPSEISHALIKAIVTQPTNLKRIYLSSTDHLQNTAVFNILKVFEKHLRDNNVKAMPYRLDNQNLFIQEGEIHWKPRVTVDGLGYLRVEMSSTSENGAKAEHQEIFVEEELDNLRVRFDWKNIFHCKQLVSLKIDCLSLC